MMLSIAICMFVIGVGLINPPSPEAFVGIAAIGASGVCIAGHIFESRLKAAATEIIDLKVALASKELAS